MMDDWKEAVMAIAAIMAFAIIFFFAAWLMGLVIHAYCTAYMTGDLPGIQGCQRCSAGAVKRAGTKIGG